MYDGDSLSFFLPFFLPSFLLSFSVFSSLVIFILDLEATGIYYLIEILGMAVGYLVFNSIGNSLFHHFPTLFFFQEERVLEICSKLDLGRLFNLFIYYYLCIIDVLLHLTNR